MSVLLSLLYVGAVAYGFFWALGSMCRTCAKHLARLGEPRCLGCGGPCAASESLCAGCKTVQAWTEVTL
ncbi:hypothetical protein DKM44_12965 [Deinococcus irradiatisoli]|uniref:Double zinc ribbon domain-containing protein n=1 Tax=Deinococcus irradiatisoli TaxID=2202254 RepID=A0A2Z3JG68_9DEIO|nr:hypothetical protein [Deinococcus irradiatisoli]AWN24032.1 hypothetical protein DKM44_12965 [Deinococcus irradiatisoli]